VHTHARAHDLGARAQLLDLLGAAAAAAHAAFSRARVRGTRLSLTLRIPHLCRLLVQGQSASQASARMEAFG
jgi:hypothetical protein